MADDFAAFTKPSSGGVDDIDFEKAAASFPDISLDGDDAFSPSAAAPAGTSSGFSFEEFDAPSNPDVRVTGDDEIDKFENQFPALDDSLPAVASPATQLPSAPSFGATPSFASPAPSTPFAPRPQQSASFSTPILRDPMPEEEPEVIKQWREKQAEEITQRDEASKAKRQETIGKAERALDAFYEEYAKKKENTIRENKESEQAYLATANEALSKGTTWARICDLIELENSQSKTLARAGPGTTELTRFREVLLRLRREGESAVGAGGY